MNTTIAKRKMDLGIIEELLSSRGGKDRRINLLQELNNGLGERNKMSISVDNKFLEKDFKNFLYLSKEFPTVKKTTINKLINYSKELNVFKFFKLDMSSDLIKRIIDLDFFHLIENENTEEIVNIFYAEKNQIDIMFESFEKRYMKEDFDGELLKKFFQLTPKLNNYTGKKNKQVLKRFVHKLNYIDKNDLSEIIQSVYGGLNRYSNYSDVEHELLFTMMYRVINNDVDNSFFEKELIELGLEEYIHELQELPISQKGILHYLLLTKSNVFLDILKSETLSSEYLKRSYLKMSPMFYVNMNLNTLNKEQLNDIVENSQHFNKVIEVFEQNNLYPTSKETSFLINTLKELSLTNKTILLNTYCLLENVAKEEDRLRVIQELINANFIDIKGSLSIEIDTKNPKNKMNLIQEIYKPIYQMMTTKTDNPYQIKNTHNYLKYLSIKEMISKIDKLNEDDILFIYELELVNGLTFDSIDEIRANVLSSEIIKELKDNIKVSDEFISKYSANILKALTGGEVNIINTYFSKSSQEIRNNFIPIVKAYLMGESSFRLMKYYHGDLERELNISNELDKQAKDKWKENYSKIHNNFEVFETDSFEDSIRLGEIPTDTCMHWERGSYKRCLLSIFDSNKKQVYVKRNGKVIARAIIRFTKTSLRKENNTSDFSFVDLDKLENGGYEEQERKTKENFVVYVEKIYTSVYEDSDIIRELIVELIAEKTKEMGVEMLMSFSFDSEKTKSVRRYMYISKSKNGYQYIDSLSGEQGPNSGGTYMRSTFYKLKD